MPAPFQGDLSEYEPGQEGKGNGNADKTGVRKDDAPREEACTDAVPQGRKRGLSANKPGQWQEEECPELGSEKGEIPKGLAVAGEFEPGEGQALAGDIQLNEDNQGHASQGEGRKEGKNHADTLSRHYRAASCTSSRRGVHGLACAGCAQSFLVLAPSFHTCRAQEQEQRIDAGMNEEPEEGPFCLEEVEEEPQRGQC